MRFRPPICCHCRALITILVTWLNCLVFITSCRNDISWQTLISCLNVLPKCTIVHTSLQKYICTYISWIQELLKVVKVYFQYKTKVLYKFCGNSTANVCLWSEHIQEEASDKIITQLPFGLMGSRDGLAISFQHWRVHFCTQICFWSIHVNGACFSINTFSDVSAIQLFE